MKIFKVEIKETLSDIIEIEANNEDDAISEAKKRYLNEEIVLTGDNILGSADFEIVEEG